MNRKACSVPDCDLDGVISFDFEIGFSMMYEPRSLSGNYCAKHAAHKFYEWSTKMRAVVSGYPSDPHIILKELTKR